MLYSKLFIRTYKEAPKDAVLKSHQYLIKANLIAQVGSGIYHMLPLGKKIFDKIKAIVKDEMDKSGAQEISMGFVTPAELWAQSGRIQKYGPELLRIKDRKNNDYVLSPTNEESVTQIAKNFIKSYKQLPINLYQINTKFRDEMRPRFGLMRGREFVMKDAYSFHDNLESLDAEFDNMEKTYRAIFDALGFKYAVVDADSGAIGGSGSKEFMVLASAGEDDIAVCGCGYAANIEAAKRVARKSIINKNIDSIDKKMDLANSGACALGLKKQELWESERGIQDSTNDTLPSWVRDIKDEKYGTQAPRGDMALFHTPNISSIESLSDFFKVSKFYTLKAVLKKAIFSDKDPCIACFFVRGDDELESTKASNVIAKYDSSFLELVDVESSALSSIGLAPGFVGPYGLGSVLSHIYFDLSLEDASSLIVGANEKDKHIVGADLSQFENLKYEDLAIVQIGDKCPQCQASLSIEKGIEVGHIFKLGDKYSKAMDAKFLDKNGIATPFIMGCYGIGVSRLISALLEQNADEKGCIWGDKISIFEVGIIISNIKDDTQKNAAFRLYEELKSKGVDVLLDDRDERFGAKMGDFELIGYRYAIIFGKGMSEHKVEIIERKTLIKEEITLQNIQNEILKRLEK